MSWSSTAPTRSGSPPSGARSWATSNSAAKTTEASQIGPPDAGFGGLQPTLILSPSSDPRTGKLRLHLDVNPTDRDQEAELERLLALGARPADVGQTGAETWHVLADPEGNEFCLLRTRLQPT